MNRYFLSFLALFIFSTHCLSAAADFMPVDQISPGMKGYGKTVFSGDSIETFDVEIIGVLNNFMPKKDIILARLKGNRLEHTGVIAGMSGSPIYIDGKLIGALAYGWSFSKDPITGITPIEQMLAIRENPELGAGASLNENSRDASYGGRKAPIGTTVFDPTNWQKETLEKFQTRPPQDAGTSAGAGLRMLNLPLVFSGSNQETIQRFSSYFSEYGMLPVSGGGGGTSSSSKPSTEGGAAVAAQLVRGDLSLAATGTLTYFDGENVLAFGHPFLQLGNVDFVMTGAEIVTVLPNMSSSFKISNTGGSFGTVMFDHANGIMGKVGAEPQMIPITVNIERNSRKSSFNYESIQNKNLISTLTSLVVFNSLNSDGSVSGEKVVGLETDIALEDAPDIKLKNTFAGQGAVAGVINLFQSLLMIVENNPYQSAKIEKMDFNLKLNDGNPIAGISEVTIDRERIKAGQKANIQIVLEPFQKTRKTLNIPVEIPEGTDPGKLLVFIGSGPIINQVEFAISPNRFRYGSLSELVELINSLKRNDRLFVKIIRQDSGLLLDNAEMDNLPPSAWTMLNSSKVQGKLLPINDVTVLEKSLESEYVLSGLKVMKLTVEKDKD